MFQSIESNYVTNRSTASPDICISTGSTLAHTSMRKAEMILSFSHTICSSYAQQNLNYRNFHLLARIGWGERPLDFLAMKSSGICIAKKSSAATLTPTFVVVIAILWWRHYARPSSIIQIVGQCHVDVASATWHSLIDRIQCTAAEFIKEKWEMYSKYFKYFRGHSGSDCEHWCYIKHTKAIIPTSLHIKEIRAASNRITIFRQSTRLVCSWSRMKLLTRVHFSQPSFMRFRNLYLPSIMSKYWPIVAKKKNAQSKSDRPTTEQITSVWMGWAAKSRTAFDIKL